MKDKLIINSRLLDRDDNGHLYYEGKLFTGTMEWYYSSGELGSTTEHVDGIPHGWGKGWYKNGQMSSQKKYTKGIVDSLVQKWYENGQIKSEREINNGEGGEEKHWDENGRLLGQ